MNNYELNADNFEKIIHEFRETPDASYSEADTRAKLIDKILHDSLGWPEEGSYIRRETHIHHGYIDYVMRVNNNSFVLEAKRVGVTFSLPTSLTYNSNLSVKNLLQKQADINLMYDQVTRYAHESGVPYCVLSNGIQWIIFPGVRIDSIHIRNSKVIVFNGFDNIKMNFVDFWNLLSYESVANGSMERKLQDSITKIERSYIFNTEGKLHIPYDRNVLSFVLTDILPRYFGDLQGDPAQTDMLQECYVSDEPIQKALQDLDMTVADEKPSKTLSAEAHVMHFYSLPYVSRKLESLIDSFTHDQRRSYLQILLGRVGIGKTTFLLHFFNIDHPHLVDDQIFLYLDFRDVSENSNLEEYFIDAMWDMFNKHHKFDKYGTMDILQKIYKSDIDLLSNGPFKILKESYPEEYSAEISRFLGREISNRPVFIKKLAAFINNEKKSRFIFVFDNVDQLPAESQERIIRFAYSKSSEYNAFLIISMWEETYYMSKRSGRTLSTLRTVPIQINRQSVTSIVVKRLKYLSKQVQNNKEPLPLLNKDVCDRDTFCMFLNLVIHSLLVDNRKVRIFLELLALGNIRRSLEMFHLFLTAGSLEAQKILDSMKRDEKYRVPEHEFVKSVMLGSKRYYSERTSDILNLFTIGDIEHPSHFTRLRMLQWLFERRHETTHFGQGFMNRENMRIYLLNIGISEKDIDINLKRLVEHGLIEDDLRSQKLISEAQAYRITPTGRYYLQHLYRQFPYIDLVMQDTPFFDKDIFQQIKEDCESVDMNVRFRRCENFIQYLSDQEEEELRTIRKLKVDITWQPQFVRNISRTFESTKRLIIAKGYC